MSTDAEKGKYTAPEGSKTWEYLTVFTSSIMAICIGFAIGWASPNIVKLMAPDSPIPVTASEISTLVVLLSIGHMLGTLASTFIVDKIGRKISIHSSALPLIIGWALIMTSTNIWMLYVARLMLGLTVGLFANIFPMYIGEIVSSNLRGAGIAVHVIMFNLGALLMFIVVPYLSLSTMAAICLAVGVSFLIAFRFMPHSPYYLAMKNRLDEAEAALEKLRGKVDVTEEMELVIEWLKSKNEEKNQRGRISVIRKLFTVRGNRRAFIISNLVICTQVFSGSVILIYGQLIFRSMTSVVSDHIANIIIGVVQLSAAIISTVVVDRLGRRPLLLISGVVATIANLTIGGFFFAKDYLKLDVSAYSLAPFVAAMLLMVAFNCGALSLQVIIMSEVFAVEIKAISSCIVNIIGGIFIIIGLKLYLLIAVTWEYGHSPPFLTSAVIMIILTSLILHLMPETKGKTFVQIQKELND